MKISDYNFTRINKLSSAFICKNHSQIVDNYGLYLRINGYLHFSTRPTKTTTLMYIII